MSAPARESAMNPTDRGPEASGTTMATAAATQTVRTMGTSRRSRARTLTP